MRFLKKRVCSFRPEPSIRAMLVEVDSLIEATGTKMTVEDVINAALRSYLPSLIVELREVLKKEKILREVEEVVFDGVSDSSSDD